MLAFLALVPSLLQATQTPVLEFPEAGLDDPAAYEGYSTRFFRDSRGNTFQVYLDAGSGRVVHVWADAANQSAAFTARDTAGRPAPVVWGGPGATPETDGRLRVMRYRLASERDALEIGWFLLGTMRQERDFQYLERHRRPFGDPPFVLTELTDLIDALERLPAGERARHLALLDARGPGELRSRLEPRVTLAGDETSWTVRVEHTSLDGRNRLTLELRGEREASTVRLADDRISLRAPPNEGIEFEVMVSTDAAALTPLDRDEILNDAFEAFYARRRSVSDSLRRVLPMSEHARDSTLTAFRRLDRDVRALELLSFEEKLMASLPNYATYFGRDMMMAALMLEPIASVELQERVIASVLRKLSPEGQVSHEEALGGQAIRENAAEYAALVRAWEADRRTDPAAAAEHLARARALLENLQAVRENYRMVDDDFQLPVLVDRYLSRPDVAAERKRRFLSDSTPSGSPRLDGLVRNLAFVAELARPYAERPVATNLVSFFHRDAEGWLPGSWRDSRAGYGNGRFAMDVNVAWVPRALEASERILRALETLGVAPEDVLSRLSLDAPALEAQLRDPDGLRSAIATWDGAHRHFEVRLAPEEVRRRLEAWLVSLPDPEREHWRGRLGADGARARPLSFLAVALDEAGRPIAAPNTDPATDLFLADYTRRILEGATDPARVTAMLDVFTRPYPVGLLVEGLGPVVVNDAYADPEVRRGFREDPYHSPRVVWGREVNLLTLGLARRIEAGLDAAGRPRDRSEPVRSYLGALRRTLAITQRAVEASGLRHNELWSYRIENGSLRPVRYGASSDLQLWNLTGLAVRFLLDRLPPP